MTKVEFHDFPPQTWLVCGHKHYQNSSSNQKTESHRVSPALLQSDDLPLSLPPPPLATAKSMTTLSYITSNQLPHSFSCLPSISLHCGQSNNFKTQIYVLHLLKPYFKQQLIVPRLYLKSLPWWSHLCLFLQSYFTPSYTPAILSFSHTPHSY